MQDNQAEAQQIGGAGVGPDPAGQQDGQYKQRQDDEGRPAPGPAPAPLEDVEDDRAFPVEQQGQGIAAHPVQPQQPVELLRAVDQAAEAGQQLNDEEYQ